ncbi:MAG: glycosyltransferase family 2 protein [Elusimicrobiota bacterium]|jgi:glycosyltransferase involved in cell wall biosynthesis
MTMSRADAVTPGNSGIPGGLSAFIIARNEEADLPACLESLRGLADEVVVLLAEDSSDRTGDLAREAGCLVSVRRFDDYARHKGAALALATREWALSIDADERATPGLREEILSVLRSLPAPSGERKTDSPSGTAAPMRPVAYEIPFAVHFMGRRLAYGGLGSERHLRLFRRDKGRFVGGALHEGIETDGPVGRLSGDMEHHPYRDLSEYLEKLDRYTTLSAAKRFAAGQRFRPWHHLILPVEFFVRVVLKLAFLDGRPGLVWAGLSAFHSWLKYVKLGQLQEKEEKP